VGKQGGCVIAGGWTPLISEVCCSVQIQGSNESCQCIPAILELLPTTVVTAAVHDSSAASRRFSPTGNRRAAATRRSILLQQKRTGGGGEWPSGVRLARRPIWEIYDHKLPTQL